MIRYCFQCTCAGYGIQCTCADCTLKVQTAGYGTASCVPAQGTVSSVRYLCRLDIKGSDIAGKVAASNVPVQGTASGVPVQTVH
jgi:hypothetical protein